MLYASKVYDRLSGNKDSRSVQLTNKIYAQSMSEHNYKTEYLCNFIFINSSKLCILK